jgi:hypothetical protein
LLISKEFATANNLYNNFYGSPSSGLDRPSSGMTISSAALYAAKQPNQNILDEMIKAFL